jgi:mycothiol synthase
MTKLTIRNYQGEDDYWRIRNFLREVYLLDDRHELGWQAARLDYWRWHMIMNVEVVNSIEEAILLWETDDGRIGAVISNVDSRHEVALTIHTNFRTPEFVDEMLDSAEKNWGTPGKNFFAFAHSLDPMRENILRARGYVQGNGLKEHQWRRNLTTPLPDVVVPEGYSVRAIGVIGGDEWPQRSWASWLAFHPDEPDDAYDPDWRWNLNWSHAPLYRRDLDIVAISPDGKVVAYCILWYDDATRTALFDPVAVIPDHQRRGICRAIVTEAMRRAKEMGAALATVSGFEPGANALYSSAFSAEHDLNVPWVKKL